MGSIWSTKAAAARMFCEDLWWFLMANIRPSPMSALAIPASFPFFLYGYDVAMVDSGTAIWHDLSLTARQGSVFVICVGRVSFAVGAFVAGVAANRFGRRYLLATGGVIYTVGALVVTFTSTYAALTVGRTLTGFGVGMGLLIGPIHIAETAASTTRGYHGFFPQVLLAAGTVAAHLLEVAVFWVPRHLAWRVMAGVVALPAAYFTYFVVSQRFTDTPSWLAMLGDLRAAERLMERGGASGTEPWDRREQLERVAGFARYVFVDPDRPDLFPGRITGFWAQVSDRVGPQLRDVSATTVLLVAQEATCEQLALTLVPVVLTRQGLGSRVSDSAARLVLAFVRLVATTVTMHVAGRSMAGRRRLLLVGTGLAAGLLGTLSGTSFADAYQRIGRGSAFALWCFQMLLLQAVLGFGLGPIPWSYGPEVFPLAARAPSVGLCLAFKFLVSTLVSWSVSALYSTFGTACWDFLVGFGVTLVSLVLSWRLVRETSCRVLMEEAD